MAQNSKTYSRILNFFIGLTVLVIAAIVHLTLAKATIYLPTDVETFAYDEPLEISQSTENDAIYGEILTIDLEGATVQEVGTKEVAGEKAAVYVTIVNNYSRQQPLIATTRMLAEDGTLYRLTEGVTVPAGGRVEVLMEADVAGEDQIVGPGKFKIPGLWEGIQEFIYGETYESSSLERITSSALTQADIDAATAKLFNELTPLALEELRVNLPATITITEDNLIPILKEAQTDAEVGDEVETFRMDATVTFKALILDKSLLKKAAEEELASKLPTGIEVIEYQQDSFSYQVSELDADNQTAVVDVHLEALVTTQPTGLSFDKTELKGLTAEEAENFLQQQGLMDAQVTLSPFWVRHVPGLADHIEITTSN